MEIKNKIIKYPYLPEEKKILYVSESNEYMLLAREYAEKYRSNLEQSGAAIVVKNKKVVGIGALGNNSTHIKGCERIKHNMPTGEGYDLCEGCSPKFHSEASAVRDAEEKGENILDTDLYLWGHWWCCKDCWEAMIKAGIKNVYLLENSEILFNKKDPNNIIGRQFEPVRGREGS